MSQPFRIRPMILADLEAVIAGAARTPGAPQWPRSAWLEALDPAHSPRRLTMLAEHDPARYSPAVNDLVYPALTTAPLGFAVASLAPPLAELESIAVLPAALRQGIGRELLRSLLALLAESSVTEVCLEVRASNLPALALYRAAGFQPSGLRPRYYADPVEDARLMRLRLP